MPDPLVGSHDATVSGEAALPEAAAITGAATIGTVAVGAGGANHELAGARWPEVAAWLRRVLVVPLGSVEQHGPHLPLDTDTRIAAAVARRACAVVTGTTDGMTGATGPGGIGLAPPVSIGASGEHADFPGTLSIGHVALSTLLLELGRHASLHWPVMLIVNGHGGNVGAISDALAKLRSEGRDCHVWHAGVRPSMLAAAGLSLVPDAHAGRMETSVMLALAPQDVRLGAAAPGDTRPLAEVMPGLREHGVGWVSANGVLGDPTGASAAEGEALLRLLVEDLAATIAQLAGPRPTS
jgi:mycofactocin system creatininase family protein